MDLAQMQAVIDMGSSKVTVLVGEMIDNSESVRILGFGEVQCQGILRDGVVTNIEVATQAISQAVRLACTSGQEGMLIDRVVIGCTGLHLNYFNNDGRVSLGNDEVKVRDRERVIEAAQEQAKIPVDYQILHTLPQHFLLDNRYVANPVGMSGALRLDVKVHLITGEKINIKNLHRCVEKSGLSVTDTVVSPLASLYAVTNASERNDGWMIVIDIGAGVTDICVLKEGAVEYTGVLNVGGERITRIVANELKIAPDEAERVKKAHGCALAALVDPGESLEVAQPSGAIQSITRQSLASVIETQYRNLFKGIKEKLDEAGIFRGVGPTAVVRLTGGAAQVEGGAKLADEFFGGIPVVLAKPVGLEDRGMSDLVDDPGHATVVGILRYCLQNRARRRSDRSTMMIEKVMPTSTAEAITRVFTVGKTGFSEKARRFFQWFKDTW